MTRDRSRLVFVSQHLAALKAAVAEVAEPACRAQTLALESSQPQNRADTAPPQANASRLPIGAKVTMIARNSNWSVGERGTILGYFADKAAIDFVGSEDGDGYIVLLDSFVADQ